MIISWIGRFIVMLCALMVTSCASITPGNDIESGLLNPSSTKRVAGLTQKQENLIVTDLVTAMIQVVELNPFTTTLQVTNPKNTLGLAFYSALEQAGYGIQKVSSDLGTHYFSYSSSTVEDESGKFLEYKVTIGGIEIWRRYTIDREYIYPASILYVIGSEGLGNIVLNEKIFTQQGGPKRSFMSGVEIESPDSFVNASMTRDVSVSSKTRIAANQQVERDQAIISSRISLFEQAQLDDEVNLDDYKRISRLQLTFPSTSMELGFPNKEALRSMLSTFEKGRDILQVVSCKDNDETQTAASRRAVRITEELVLHGIATRFVINDTCKPAEYGKAKNPKSVVVVHRRRVSGSEQVVSSKLPNMYPSRPIVVTIPYGAGGATDYQARIVTMLAGSENVLGQPMVIVNKPGKGGRNGWTWFSQTAGVGGYDVAAFNLPHFIAQSIKFKDVPYNIDTLEPIAGWGADPAVLVVPMDSPFKSIRDLILYAKRNPGKLTINGAGLYVGHHIATLQLEESADIALDYKTSKGGAAALEEVISGSVQAGMNNMSDAFRARAKLRILAIADIKRNRDFLPNVPTFLEQGLAIDDSSVNFRGLMVPKGTPENVIKTLETAAEQMFTDSSVKAKMIEGGSPLKYISRNEVLAMWQERQRYLEKLLERL